MPCHSPDRLHKEKGDNLQRSATSSKELPGGGWFKWAEVDLETGTMRVRSTLSETRSGYVFEPPKNGKGRSIKLTQAASEILRCHLKRQLE
jgi:hypothetical protein